MTECRVSKPIIIVEHWFTRAGNADGPLPAAPTAGGRPCSHSQPAQCTAMHCELHRMLARWQLAQAGVEAMLNATLRAMLNASTDATVDPSIDAASSASIDPRINPEHPMLDP